MKRLLITGILLIYSAGCSKGANIDLEGVDEVFGGTFIAGYKVQWGDYRLTSAKTVEVVRKYLGKKYSVIWKGDTNADDVTDYLVVKRSGKYHKGTIKGLIVDEHGKVYMDYDRKKGFHSQGRLFYDFRRMGLKKGDVAVIRLLFDDDDLPLTREHYRKEIKGLKLTGNKHYGVVRGFAFQLIDHDGCVIGASPNLKQKSKRFMAFLIAKVNDLYKDRVTVAYWIFSPREQKAHELYKQWVALYRKDKAAGKAPKAVNFDPEALR